MELTKTYISNREIEHENYLAYREKKAKEFMKVIEEGLGKNMTHRELKNMEFGFKKGMDTITHGGKFIAKEVVEHEHIR